MTILSDIQKSKNNGIDPELHQLIIHNVEILLAEVCNINVSSISSYDNNHFVLDVILEHEIVYKFVYGEVRIISYYDVLEVTVLLIEHKRSMTKEVSEWWIISVNDDMIYKSAIFSSTFKFGKNLSVHSNNPSSELSVFRKIDNNFKANMSISYVLYDYLDNFVKRIEFDSSDMPAIFFKNNNIFYEQLRKMLKTCSKRPSVFYDVFNEYPSLVHLTTDSEYFKIFLLRYCSEYMTEKKMLDSNIMLLDMMDI